MAETQNTSELKSDVIGKLAASAQTKTTEDRERLYTLRYRKGAQLLSKNFPFKGPLGAAMERAREHCKIMGVRFVLVNPLVVDLEYQEQIKRETGRDPEEQN